MISRARSSSQDYIIAVNMVTSTISRCDWIRAAAGNKEANCVTTPTCPRMRGIPQIFGYFGKCFEGENRCPVFYLNQNGLRTTCVDRIHHTQPQILESRRHLDAKAAWDLNGHIFYAKEEIAGTFDERSRMEAYVFGSDTVVGNPFSWNLNYIFRDNTAVTSARNIVGTVTNMVDHGSFINLYDEPAAYHGHPFKLPLRRYNYIGNAMKC